MGGSPAQSVALAPDRSGVVPRAAAWSLWLVTIAAQAIALLVWVMQGFPAPPVRFIESAGGAAVVPAAAVYSTVFATVGLFLAHHHPRNPIGWMFQLIGLPMALIDLAHRWLGPAVQSGRVTFAHELVAWLNSSLHLSWVGLLVLLVLLLFPDGRLPSPAWRPAVWIAVVAAAAGAVGFAIEPGTLYWAPAIQNPFAIRDPDSMAYLLVRVVGVLGAIVATALAAFGLVVRYRAGDEDERRQLKWIAYAGVILAVVAAPFAVARILFPTSTLNAAFIPVLQGLASLLPLATVVAITRYRLYDIDLLVNRTLVAAIVAGVVAALFGVVSTVLQRLSVGLGGDESELSLIASTLIVASLIGPVGRVVDRFIEQRVNPAKVSAGPRGSSPKARSNADLAEEMAELRRRLARIERIVGDQPAIAARARRRKTS